MVTDRWKKHELYTLYGDSYNGLTTTMQRFAEGLEVIVVWKSWLCVSLDLQRLQGDRALGVDVPR